MRKIKETYIDEEGHEVIVFDDRSKHWFKNGIRHRDGDKPAVVYEDGSKRWFKNGELHRDGDKSAVVFKDGTKEWFKNGKLHRENNPAIDRKTSFDFFLNGKFSFHKKYWIRLLLMEY